MEPMPFPTAIQPSIPYHTVRAVAEATREGTLSKTWLCIISCPTLTEQLKISVITRGYKLRTAALFSAGNADRNATLIRLGLSP